MAIINMVGLLRRWSVVVGLQSDELGVAGRRERCEAAQDGRSRGPR